MTATDARYGRRGGAWAGPPPTTPTEPRHLPTPDSPEALAKHLTYTHGLPRRVVADATPAEHDQWHTAEHRYHTLLDHDHDTPPAQAASVEHQALLVAAAKGKLRGDALDAILRRAEYASQRRSEGHRLSRYDRECLEIAQVIAERNARRARKGRAA